MTGDGNADPNGNSDEINSLKEASAEAKRTLDHQLNWIQQTDNKAVRILRANILLLGLILTALSLSTRTDALDISQFTNLFSISGLLFLVISSIGAGVTYISSSFQAGVGSEDLEDIVGKNYGEAELLKELVGSYGDWIEYNQYVLGFNAFLVTTTIIFVIDSIAFLSGGVVVGIFGAAFSWLSGVAFVIVLIVLFATNYGIYRSEDFVVWYFRQRDQD